VSNPVTWITSTLEGEKAKLKRMSSEGTGAYLLVTNVPSTSVPKRGRMDLVDAAISKIGQEVGLSIYVWWRADLDARLDAAPSELKFAYPNMLVGPDAMRALLANAFDVKRVAGQRAMIRAAAQTGWDVDKTVGFRQGKLEGVPLDDLFVDVTATRTHDLGQSRGGRGQQGALKLLTSAEAPRQTMIYGAPGQGKSTLIQRLCQHHRQLLLAPPGSETEQEQQEDVPRIPFKVILRDFAVWLAGYDPLEVLEKKRPRAATDSVESFVAHLMHHDSGGFACRVEDVVDIASRFPSLFAFDGLDEVADTRVRERVVQEIKAFDSRSSDWDAKPRLVVTSRPSFDRLPEPSNDIFINFNLDAVNEPLRIEYLRKWARSQDLSSKERHEVERVFRERSGQEHVRELATNPMQLTILLYLIHQRGDSVPHRRTNLYEDYLQSFLDREASKSETVKIYRDQLQAITAFLGWHLQSRAESDGANGRESRHELIRLTKHFLVDNGREELVSLADELFTAVTARVWVLTSRVTGSFEFDVQSIREYFAARYLFDRAPSGRKNGVDIFQRFMELVTRPYWANTARFMAGMFRFGEKAQLADDLIAGILDSPHRFWPRRFGLTLLRDGVFDDQPAPRKRLIEVTTDRLGIRVAVRDIDAGIAQPIANDRGGAYLAEVVSQSIRRSPDDRLALERTRLLAEYLTEPEFVIWWSESLAADMSRRSRWLEIGIVGQVGPHLRQHELVAFEDASRADASLLLKMGVTPNPEGLLAGTMLRCVLDGRNVAADTAGRSLAAALAATLDLGRLIQRTHAIEGPSTSWDVQAQKRFASFGAERADELVRARRERAGQRGTTSMYASLADLLVKHFGRSVLASEIALIGAMTSGLRMGHSAERGDKAFGPLSTPSALIRDVREHASDVQWWRESGQTLLDEHDRITWLLAVLSCAPTATLLALLPDARAVLEALPSDEIEVVFTALSVLGTGWGSSLAASLIPPAAEQSADLAVMVLMLCSDGLYRTEKIDPRKLRSPFARRVLATDLWDSYPPPEGEVAEDIEALVSAPADVLLRGTKSGTMLPVLSEAVRIDGPWALLQWRDRDEELGALSASLREVSTAQGWFEAAN
jgi:hypothetical protein